MNTRFYRTGPGPFAGFLFACVLCFGLIARSAAQSAEGRADGAVGETVPVAVPGDETALLLDTGDGIEGVDAAGGTPTVFLLLRVVLVLAFVCACIYGVIWLLKKSSRINAARDPYLRSLAHIPLSQSASARVISVGSQAFLVGVTEQSVSLIAEIRDRELIDAMNLEAERTSGEPVGPFEGVLARFLPGSVRAGSAESKTGEVQTGERPRSAAREDDDGSSATLTAEFIRRQRERLASSRPDGNPSGGGSAE